MKGPAYNDEATIKKKKKLNSCHRCSKTLDWVIAKCRIMIMDVSQ